MTETAADSSKNKKGFFGLKSKLAFGVLAFTSLYSSFFIVDQTEQAVITRLQKPVKVILNPVDPNDKKISTLTEEYRKEGIPTDIGPGVYFKLPFIESLTRYDRRLLRWEGYPEQINTADKRFIWLEASSRWNIFDPLTYLRAVREQKGGYSKLDDIIDGEVRSAITSKNLLEVVRTDNREMKVSEEELKETVKVDNIFTGRRNIAHYVTNTSRDRLEPLGIGIDDEGVLFNSITYVESVKTTIEDRMIAERNRIAEKYKSEGEAEYSRIMGEKDKELKKINSEAYKTAEEKKGSADAQATKIYADTYSKDPEFFKFQKTLEFYRSALPGKELVIGTDNQAYNLLKGPNPSRK